jgi:UDP-3-O-[3-hydroxymyristoyl] glucosamine N-acyltransferase
MADLTARELAQKLGLPIRGDGSRIITGAAPFEEATPDQLSFIGSPRYFEAGARSEAACLIAPAEFPARPGQTIIESPQPRAHFAEALSLLYAPPSLTAGTPVAQTSIHETAAVDPTAKIGDYVTIGAGSVVEAGAVIGPGCSIGDHVVIKESALLYARVTLYNRVVIGARSILHSGTVIGADGFGFEMTGGRYRKVPQVGSVEIGDDCEIGANCTIDRATLGVTVIGEGTKLDNMVHIGHNCKIGKHVVIVAQTGLGGGVTVGDYAVIGGQVGVGDKARIESKAVIGSGAGILTSKIVRAGEPVWGTPARPLKQYLRQLATLSRLSKKRKSESPED